MAIRRSPGSGPSRSGLYSPRMLQTARDSEMEEPESGTPIAGLLVLWSGGLPRFTVLRVPPPGLLLGRETLDAADDERLSRRHAQVRWNGSAFEVADLGSRNGTFVGGTLVVDGEVTVSPSVVVRVGRTVCLLVRDVQPYVDGEITTEDGVIVGPILRKVWEAAERAARAGASLLVTGESGAGKELAAQAFHHASKRTGPLVAVNCAAIPAGVAERLLFGAKKGAYSGADRDAIGYLAAADGGTLFLDEIAELDLQVQAKLLRVLETGELLPLGAARPQSISIRVVAATLRDLRAAVEAGRFRDDLYFRIGRPEVHVPPLRERPEELVRMVAHITQAIGIRPHPAMIEACLLRPWPGNVRELLGEVRRAAQLAVEAGRQVVRVEDLDEHAGRLIGATAVEHGTGAGPRKPAPLPSHDTILSALREEGGNVTAAAKRLGLHRNQLRRYMSKFPEIKSDDNDEALP